MSPEGERRPEWVSVDRPGYAGKDRDERRRRNDERYGEGNWRTAWEHAGKVLTLDAAVLIYEEAYYRFLNNNPDVVEQLVREAKDVYDDAPSNVHSGLDYSVQETGRTHLQDISIRRVVRRLGHTFQGSRLIRIRDKMGSHPLSMTLSPGRVPFHEPASIKQPELKGWWEPGSVESWYQSNKVLQVKSSALLD